MFGESNQSNEMGTAISTDDLHEYAGEWAEAEQTKRWAEEQLKALVPPGAELRVGSYLILREGDSIQILPGQ